MLKTNLRNNQLDFNSHYHLCSSLFMSVKDFLEIVVILNCSLELTIKVIDLQLHLIRSSILTHHKCRRGNVGLGRVKVLFISYHFCLVLACYLI